MTIVVRDCSETDDLDAVHEGWRGWLGEGTMRELLGSGDFPRRLMVAEDDGVLVGTGYGLGVGAGDGHRGLGHVYVRRDHRRRGVGRALWQAVLEVCTPERVPGVLVQVDDGDEGAKQVLADHGFEDHGLHLESQLELARAEEIRPLSRVPDGGDVRVASLAEGATEDEWRGVHAAYVRLMADAPDMAGGSEPMPFALWRRLIREPWQVLGAWSDGRLVGLTVLAPRAGDGALNTWFTGVDRDRRGQGLATCLKAAQACALAEAGWVRIVTQNMEGNDAILAANRRLGFVTTGGMRAYVLDF
ncbi:GNAT family N-acetyltransferase [Nocardioides iriomotensis]|uniref:GNAT family N-acetyltransferase n=1 Tax=Nocardioides iriomotensis TaxID=715784 RepID=A0A4Q5J933_9ACTN|nr:GNAT family N-acetyltransferase [Nocardioides iriomotensis]RYU15252.1 GNAT family N-acetyltransferase [Nocardioides iriomotensis]